MQPGIPQVHSAVPVAPITATNMAAQMSVPVAAPMMVSGAALGPTDGGAAGPVIPSQMVPIGYPATYDYAAPFIDPRAAAAPVIPRRSRRSRRDRHRNHHHHHHRSRRRSRSPTPSTGSSASDTETRYSSPSSYDSADYSRHHREHNPLPRPPKDILASTPFRPLLTQLPSAQYNSWGLRGTSVPASQAPQPQSQPTTYGNVRPRRQRRGLFNLRPRDQFPGSSLSAAANTLARPFMPGRMSMPEPHPAPPAPSGGFETDSHVPPVIPSSPHMRMPSPEPVMPTAPPPHGQTPVIPQGINMTPMRSPAPPGSTPFLGAGLPTPRTPRTLSVPPPPVTFAPSRSSTPMPMSMPMPGGGGGGGPPTMSMPSPGVIPTNFAQVPAMTMPTPGMGMGMGMPSPSLGAGAMPGTGGVAPVLKFNGYGEYSGLLYHSPHSVVYEDDLYPTALHLFEARKFLDHRPDLANRIKDCARVEDVTAISAELSEFTRRDWGNVALSTVSICPLFSPPLADRSWTTLCLRWTRYCTSSSASTETCARCYSTRTPHSSSTSSPATHSGETALARA